MNETDPSPLYHIWSLKNKNQSPIELPALVSRIKGGEVQARTWIYVEAEGKWHEAGEIAELKMFFKRPEASVRAPGTSAIGSIKPGSLRRMKIFADMDDEQLAAFIPLVKVNQYRAFNTVVQKGDHGDSMFLVLEGELRARTVIDGRESTLVTLSVGDFFGEIALLDHGPRSADILANQDSLVLEITSSAVEKLVREQPQAAAPFLLALGRSVVGRMRHLTKRYEDTVHFSRAAGSVVDE